MNTQNEHQSNEKPTKKPQPTRRFRIEKLEERIAPVGPGTGNGSGPECRFNPQGKPHNACFSM